MCELEKGTGGGGGMALFIYDLKVGSARSDLRTESIYFSDPRIKYDISQIYSDLTLEWTTTLGGGGDKLQNIK